MSRGMGIKDLPKSRLLQAANILSYLLDQTYTAKNDVSWQ